MSEEHHEDIDKRVRAYLVVFLALIALTIATVGVSYLHVSTPMHITLALLIAVVKGALVAGIFMHLFDERKVIYWVLALTITFFGVLLLVPALTSIADQVSG